MAPYHSPLRLFHTVRHLKPRQIGYRGYYLLRDLLGKPGFPTAELGPEAQAVALTLPDPVPRASSLTGPTQGSPLSGRGFTFLNLSHRFPDGIDWDFADLGRLWSYHLNYFDFLNQPSLDREEGLRLIGDFLADLPGRRVGLEPYPTSLRIMNWVRFLARHRIRDAAIEQSLYRQALHLMNHLEYHLLGNHLLENAFALLFAALLFPAGPFGSKAERLLDAELPEQILPDGAHFELSPMYHQIMLDRVLDGINLLQCNGGLPGLLPLLRAKASLMLGWLRQVTWASGEIPLVNDAALGIAPSTSELFAYARRLGVPVTLRPLGASGYRKVDQEAYEMLVDVGQIGPDYLPGHAHSDTFNFLLQVRGRPVIVDTGLSTYESCARRLAERGTAAHNSVQIDGLEQSEVWDSFRVARRCRVRDLEQEGDTIRAWHDGYCRIGARHAREFRFGPDCVTIRDSISSGKKHDVRARIHFHPEIQVTLEGERLTAGPVRIQFSGDGPRSVQLAPYRYAPGFNTLLPAQVAEVCFSGSLTTHIAVGGCHEDSLSCRQLSTRGERAGHPDL